MRILTFAILLVCCISVTLTQFIGDPIFCISNALGPKAKAEMKAVNIYCLISSTFTLPDEYDKETGADVAHPGLGVDAPEKDKRYHSYYIWVPIVLLLQAISFRIPHLLWKGFEGGRLRAIIVESSTVVLGLDKRQEVESRVLDYLETFKGRHNLWFFKYVLCEFLNFVVVVGNIYATDAFLGHEFSKYGLEVVQFLDEDPRSRTDPMVREKY
ncbi:unnamed protein product [Darwinula stevensoni]|uniref:Innexin n=1 Tax=Darwinula stevensoni TaxID=69355 RepID=A0A7R9A6P0_9CRUS|nr:unnamed protein product [Darwinula stevensoni]CAG0889852.1 unnamed protein product [Darwinula stevensoni]